MYFSWMLIALSAMTGNINKRGGGFGEIRLDDGYSVKLAPAPAITSITPHDAILFSVFKSNDVILNGLDGRTSGQLREDVLAMNKIDLGPDARTYNGNVCQRCRGRRSIQSDPEHQQENAGLEKAKIHTGI